MITLEHRWVPHPEGGRRTRCERCLVVCDTSAVDAGGPFFAADGTPCGHTPPPCPLVPESHHTPGPWRVSQPIALDYRAPLVYALAGESLASLIAVAEGGGPIRAVDGAEARANAALIARAPAMRDALEATLLFHASVQWDEEAIARWQELTGTEEATTRTLCNAIRKALR